LYLNYIELPARETTSRRKSALELVFLVLETTGRRLFRSYVVVWSKN